MAVSPSTATAEPNWSPGSPALSISSPSCAHTMGSTRTGYLAPSSSITSATPRSRTTIRAASSRPSAADAHGLDAELEAAFVEAGEAYAPARGRDLRGGTVPSSPGAQDAGRVGHEVVAGGGLPGAEHRHLQGGGHGGVGVGMLGW